MLSGQLKLILPMLMALALPVLLLGCDTGKRSAKGPGTDPDIDDLGAPAKPPPKRRAEPRLPIPQLTPDQQAAVNGNTAFALALYRQLAEQEGNVVVSPYSVTTALAITYAGARGRTAEEMAQALHFTLPQERLHATLRQLTRGLITPPDGEPQALHLANALWAQEGLGFLPDFLQITTRHYAAGLRRVDFGDSETARQAINRWVAKETREQIPHLLEPADLTPNVRLVLVNALHFKADWETRFEKSSTRDAVFHISSDRQVVVPMMRHWTKEFLFHWEPGVKILELPYQGGQFGMVLVLPDSVDGLRQVEREFTADRLERWLARLRPVELDVDLPRFKASRRSQLVAPLTRMGMTLPFTARADFSGINDGPAVCISQIVHQALVEVDEQGTSAAAATAVLMGDVLRTPVFRADHPFLFLVRERLTGNVLFVGRLTAP